MSWSMRRRLIILAIIIVLIGGGIAGGAYLTLHKAPSCTDGIQNQKEEGIDCGGPCLYLCSISQTPPSVRFVRALSPVPGRTDVIAYIDNPNPASATQQAPFTIELYDESNALIARKSGVTVIPAAGTVPVFVPDFFSGSQTVAHAYLTFDAKTIPWFTSRTPLNPPKVQNVVYTAGTAPRVTAIAVNPTAVPMHNVSFVVTVFDEAGKAIGASRTVAGSIPPQGEASLVFTWPSVFTGTVSRVDVIPLVLPKP